MDVLITAKRKILRLYLAETFLGASRHLVKPDHQDSRSKYDIMSIKKRHGDQMNLEETV